MVSRPLPWFLFPALLSLLALGTGHVLAGAGAWGIALSSVSFAASRWVLLFWLPLAAGPGPWRLPGLAALVVIGLPFPVNRFQPGQLRVVHANVQVYSDGRGALEGALSALDADVVVTQESRERSIDGMYLVASTRDPTFSAHRVQAWCRLGSDCRGQVFQPLGKALCGFPILVMRVSRESSANEADLCVVDLHVPPVPYCASAQLPYLEPLLSVASGNGLLGDLGPCGAGMSLLVLGDLNASQGSAPYSRLTHTGLKASLRWPRFLGGGWPDGGGWPLMPVLQLDHVFSGGSLSIKVHQRSLPSTDHRALVADLG